MLNELLLVERETRQAGIDIDGFLRHEDVKDAGGKRTLKVQLDANGRVANVALVPSGVALWTLRNAKQNSFPYIQLRHPLWSCSGGNEWRGTVSRKKRTEQRKELIRLADEAHVPVDAFSGWPELGFLKRLRERGRQLSSLRGTEAAIVRTAIARFLLASRQARSGEPQPFLHNVVEAIIDNLRQDSREELTDVAMSLLVGRKKKNKDEWECGAALLIDATGFTLSIADGQLIPFVSKSLESWERDTGKGSRLGICALTGATTRLVSGDFHEPNLPVIRQTFLFAKNRDAPANNRYRRSASEAMPVGKEIEGRLSAAMKALTSDERRNITWREIPREKPRGGNRQSDDLLISFVEGVPNATVAASLAEEDFSSEVTDTDGTTADSVAAFEKRTERLLDLVKAKVGADVTQTPVRMVVLRAVDTANRKVVYSDTPTVANLYQAATSWAHGERNVPPWVELSIRTRDTRTWHPSGPLHVAPLGLIAFSKESFSRGGTRAEEVAGVPSAEVMHLFLGSHRIPRQRAESMLRITICRRATLLAGVAHICHWPECCRRRSTRLETFDQREALRTITVLGVLLDKCAREKEVYMDQTAFKLGQLLAGADVLHAGYCADVRGGDVPPSLLGNQVFHLAQTSPVTALAVLCRRWKPYYGWAEKAARETGRTKAMVSDPDKTLQQRGWDIRKALRYAREMKPLALSLAQELCDCRIDDTFRAELLLGYIAEFPKSKQLTPDLQEDRTEQEED